MKKFLIAMLFSVVATGCQHSNSNVTESNLTVGKVQREVSVGMTSSGVIEALGSPNVISTDKEGREVWVYDKMSTEVQSSSTSQGLITGLFVSFGSSSSSRTQSTLTIIVKFDEKNLVRKLSYHRSRF